MIYTIDYYTHKQCAPDWNLNDESLPYYNITFVFAGEATFVIDGKEVVCLAGDCLFLYPGAKRKAWTNPENPMVCAAFNIVDIPYAINLPHVMSFRKNSRISFYIREFDAAYRREPKNRLQLSALITLLLCELDVVGRLTNQSNPHIELAEQHIKENICSPMSADDIAKIVHLNPTYFGTLFKRCTGESVMGYINYYKMIAAASFLSDPKISVTEASEKVGFSDIYYFSKVFKKHYGISPTSFKKGEFPKRNFESYTLNHADSIIRFATIPFEPQSGKAVFSFCLVANYLPMHLSAFAPPMRPLLIGRISTWLFRFSRTVFFGR
ncbi:MAG: AraC family transcriptional regulator [Clostridia bacterium]|nr:AraC family transcriptional regulator [Clostridia bacterium]